jgi:hypothetical protein
VSARVVQPGSVLPSADLKAAVARLRTPAIAIGALGVAASAAALFLAPAAFFPSWLFACMFCLGLTLGCQAILMLHHVTGGAWGVPLRRSLEAASRTLPVVGLLFLPLFFGLSKLYEWARPEEVAKDPILAHKAPYLNVPFFSGRALVFFAAWLAFSLFLNRWSREQDEAPKRGLTRRLQLLSSAGLVVYGLTITFFAIDWVMSLEPHWYSTMYGVLYITGQSLSGFAFIVAVTVFLSRHEPLSGFVRPGHLHDMGKLMLAMVMLWSYVAFSQYLIIWAGNLPEEIPWYLKRLQGGWGMFGAAIVLLHFVLPFLLLLPATANKNPRILVFVAMLVVAMRLVDVFWMVRPASSPARFALSWTDVAAPAAVLGVWLFVYLGQLVKRPLLPVNDPEYRDAIEKSEKHGSGHS